MPGAYSAAVGAEDEIHGTAGAAGRGGSAAERLGAEAAAAHPGWAVAAAAAVAVLAAAAVQLGKARRSLSKQCPGDFVGCGRLCIHIAQSPDRTATPAEAAGMRGGRWWEAVRTTCDCAAATMPMGWSRRGTRNRCWSSPLRGGEQLSSPSCRRGLLTSSSVPRPCMLTHILGGPCHLQARRDMTAASFWSSRAILHSTVHCPLDTLRCRFWHVDWMGALCSSSRSA